MICIVGVLLQMMIFEMNYLFFMLTYIVLLLYMSVNGLNTSLLRVCYLFLNTLLPVVDLESVLNFTIPKLAYSLALSIVTSTDLLHPEKFRDLVCFCMDYQNFANSAAGKLQL